MIELLHDLGQKRIRNHIEKSEKKLISWAEEKGFGHEKNEDSLSITFSNKDFQLLFKHIGCQLHILTALGDRPYIIATIFKDRIDAHNPLEYSKFIDTLPREYDIPISEIQNLFPGDRPQFII